MTATEPTVLVIDDEEIVRELIVEMLDASGFNVVATDAPERALELLDDPSVALVISDIVMPGLTGFDLLEQVRIPHPCLPVLLVTGAGTEDTLSQALAHGASGLIRKPFTRAELDEAVRAVLDRVRASERDLYQRLLAPTLATALANTIEARDGVTGGHTERLALIAMRLGVELDLDRHELEIVRLGAILHDIGKIGIPDRVLLKPGPLDPQEQALMRTHALIGDRLLAPLDPLAAARPVVRHHHERWDGGTGGYPDGLAGDKIPAAARIVALADALEAMSANRPYRQPLVAAQILAELERGRGSQWDPRLVDVVSMLLNTGELRVGPGGVWLGDSRAERPNAEVADLAESMLPDLLASLRELRGQLDRHVITTSELERWFEAQAETGHSGHRRDALRALDALDGALRDGR